MGKKKTIRVRIKGNIRQYRSHGKTYLPGDTLVVDEGDFVGDFMVNLDAPKPKPTVKAEAPVEIEGSTQLPAPTSLPKTDEEIQADAEKAVATLPAPDDPRVTTLKKPRRRSGK